MSQKAKRVRFRDLKSVLPPQLHEISVIPLLTEHILTVVPAIEDVIEISKRKLDWVGGHGCILLLMDRPDMSHPRCR